MKPYFPVLLSFLLVPAAFAGAEAPVNLLSLERMGAGVPAGWLLEGIPVDWETESGDGPFGPGAARIRFNGPGHVTLMSPARYLPPDTPHLAAVWVRSEPAGASVSLELLDNNRSRAGLRETETISGEWTPFFLHGILERALKDRYYLRVSFSGEDLTLWVDGLCFSETGAPPAPDWQPDLHPAAVVLRPEDPWGVVTGDRPWRVQARVAGALPPEARLALHAVHTNGQTADLPPVLIGAGTAWEDTFTVDGDITQPYGMIRLEARVTDSAGKPLSPMTETLLARAPEPAPGPRPDSPFGVHVSLRDSDLDAVSRLGYKWCRLHDASAITNWGYVEPEPGQWTWFDDEVALARQYGFSIMGMLSGSPAWESGTDKQGYWRIFNAPRNIGNWRKYVRETVAHYAGRIDDWEVWNEPWDMQRFFAGGTPQLYVQLLRAAYEEAKAVHPSSTIVGVNTYPPIWDMVILGMGALPYYDVISWHRYDPTLLGRPNDSVARVRDRLHRIQNRYGVPKPSLCSEGGPDVTPFHGSFFSFADPVILGDWSEGLDRYTRWFLSTIAAGHQRFIAYSVHNAARHGHPTHMMTEPDYLLRPMHLGVSALAYFIEGAAYVKRLAPGPDISAHIFRQPETRPYAEGPSTVIVLHADGADPEPLPQAIPEGVHCFDRWANPMTPPREASRGLAYLIPDTAVEGDLLGALRSEPLPGHEVHGIEVLLRNTVAALSSASPPLWSLCSSQGAVFIHADDAGYAALDRAALRAQPITLFPRDTKMDRYETGPEGRFCIGEMALSAGDRHWNATFSAVPDHPGGGWRYVMLTLIEDARMPETEAHTKVERMARDWEDALEHGNTDRLHGIFSSGPCCAAAATVQGEYFVFRDPSQLVTMFDTAVIWGGAKRSELEIVSWYARGGVVTLRGQWNISSMPFGEAVYGFTGTYLREADGWKCATLCASAP